MKIEVLNKDKQWQVKVHTVDEKTYQRLFAYKNDAEEYAKDLESIAGYCGQEMYRKKLILIKTTKMAQ